MRVVIDTNVLLVCISDRSPYHGIFKAFIENQFEICVTTEILDEYAEILARYSSKHLSAFALNTIENAKNTHYITRYYAFELIKIDPDDNKFVDCAIAANADFIVTNDAHFSVLKEIPFPKVSTIKIDDFMEMLNSPSLDISK